MARESDNGDKGQALSYTDVLDILEIVDGVGEGCELTVDVGDFHLHFVKDAAGGASASPEPAPGSEPAVPEPQAAETEESAPTEASETEAFSADEPADPNLFEVESPMVGTFYRRPAPDRPPFVEIGQDVGPDDAVCLVEVMKLFNTIVAGKAGRIAEICVEDATPVAVGQVLVRIDPAD